MAGNIQENTEHIQSCAKFTYQAAVTFSILQMLKLGLREATPRHTINKRYKWELEPWSLNLQSWASFHSLI